VFCGDRIVQPPKEECDDGNIDPGDGCDEFCQIEPSDVDPCDWDGNGAIDRFDIGAIFAARNTSTTPYGPGDSNGDGLITVNDGRLCVLECDNPRCAP
jgi:cysteine-rich repeat protein